MEMTVWDETWVVRHYRVAVVQRRHVGHSVSQCAERAGLCHGGRLMTR